MNRAQILGLSSMPAASPSYPLPPFRFINREFMIVVYQSDPDAIRAAVPEPLVPDPSYQIFYEWIRMPDSSGFGDYTESGIVIPAKFRGESVNFTAQMYLDCDPPIAGGREIWGFPKKLASPKLGVSNGTLTGRLEFSGQPVAIATMAYKHQSLRHCPDEPAACDFHALEHKLGKTQVNLKLIPHVDGTHAIAQLVAYNLEDITIKGGWLSPARLHLIPHANAPVADFPVRRIVEGRHFIADLSLPYGRVLYDYLREGAAAQVPELRAA